MLRSSKIPLVISISSAPLRHFWFRNSLKILEDFSSGCYRSRLQQLDRNSELKSSVSYWCINLFELLFSSRGGLNFWRKHGGCV
ncbi:hypothetical protein SDJN03_12465, partial [Cucurbita argyrosperma subsp. sororia]